MQENIEKLIRDFIIKEDSKFLEIQGGSFIQSETGEFITKSEHDKILQSKLEKFKTEMFATANSVSNTEFGIENEQSLIKKKTPKKKKNVKARENFDNGDFNIVYRSKIEEVVSMKLSTNEKLVFYIMRDFIQYPTNCIVINNNIPTIKELEPIIGLTERSIITALVSLEKKNMVKRVQYGHKKAIYINPDYCASGKDLDIETLRMFNLIECDNDKINSYLEDCL